MATLSNIQNYFITGAMSGFVTLLQPNINAFSYNVKQDGAALNNVIQVPFASANSASNQFNYTTGYVGNNGQIAGKNVTLNTLMYQPWQINDAESKMLTPAVIGKQGAIIGRKLAVDFISASWANVISNANYTVSSSYSAVGFSSSLAVANLDQLANQANWTDGPDNRFLIANTTLWNALLQNTNIANAYAFGGADAVRYGKIPAFFGFSPLKTNVTLPASDNGFICNPNAIVIGMAYHQPQNEAQNLVTSVRIDDEVSGLVIGYREWYVPALATTQKIVEVLGGSAVGDSTALIHIK